jgi:hypothetical protein
MFTFRRMRPDDKPALMEIASRIWEGSDYLPGVFDEWVADERGEFAAVLLDGRLVGCGKLTCLTDTDAWLEGVRKDPGVVETGLADAVARRFLRMLAQREGLTSLRFSTYVKNQATIVTHERLGFRVRAALSVKSWQGTRVELAGAARRHRAARSSSPREVVTVSDRGSIAAFLGSSDYFAGTQGLLVEGWRAYPYTPERFMERYVPGGACRGVYKGADLAGLAAWVISKRPGRTGVKLAFLDAADDQTAGALLDDIFRGLTAAPGLGVDAGETREVEWMVPPGERFRRWCESCGLSSWEQENDFLVYELPLEMLSSHAREENRRGT